LVEQWKVTVGVGDSTPALVGDKLYAFGRQENDEVTLRKGRSRGFGGRAALAATPLCSVAMVTWASRRFMPGARFAEGIPHQPQVIDNRDNAQGVGRGWPESCSTSVRAFTVCCFLPVGIVVLSSRPVVGLHPKPVKSKTCAPAVRARFFVSGSLPQYGFPRTAQRPAHTIKRGQRQVDFPGLKLLNRSQFQINSFGQFGLGQLFGRPQAPHICAKCVKQKGLFF